MRARVKVLGDLKAAVPDAVNTIVRHVANTDTSVHGYRFNEGQPKIYSRKNMTWAISLGWARLVFGVYWGSNQSYPGAERL